MYYEFQTEAESITAQAAIHALRVAAGYVDVSASTGMPLDPQITTAWDTPRCRVDGMWVVRVAEDPEWIDAPMAEQDPSWWPEETE